MIVFARCSAYLNIVQMRTYAISTAKFTVFRKLQANVLLWQLEFWSMVDNCGWTAKRIQFFKMFEYFKPFCETFCTWKWVFATKNIINGFNPLGVFFFVKTTEFIKYTRYLWRMPNSRCYQIEVGKCCVFFFSNLFRVVSLSYRGNCQSIWKIVSAWIRPRCLYIHELCNSMIGFSFSMNVLLICCCRRIRMVRANSFKTLNVALVTVANKKKNGKKKIQKINANI